MSTGTHLANTNDPLHAPIVKSISVSAPIEIAFRVFAEQMSTWWGLENHHIGAAKAIDVVVELHPEGRWYEKGEDGSECDWGRVLAYDPPSRLLLSWQISAEWKFDPSLHTEVEIRFESDINGGTKVTLEHRGLENYGPAAAAIREMLSPGWTRTLQMFAERASRRSS